MTKYLCPVCGFAGLTDPPENFSICPSCGTEFGYHDVGVSWAELRALWLTEGAQWFSQVRLLPASWGPYDQLIRAGLISPYTALSADSQTIGESVFRVEPKPTVRTVKRTPIKWEGVSLCFADLQPV